MKNLHKNQDSTLMLNKLEQVNLSTYKVSCTILLSVRHNVNKHRIKKPRARRQDCICTNIL